MNTGWETKLLRECTIKIASGATPKGGKESYLDRGISLIRSQNIHDFRFSIDGLAFIDTDQAHNLRNVIVEENDVLVNITGDSVARVCSAPKEHLPARVNQHVAIIRPRKDLLDWIFLKYYLLSPGEKANLLMLSSSGATRNALTKGMLENLKINLPPLPEQKAIAHILGTLDEKVELNRKMNQTLEAMAQALFKSWFVDFDPVIDNAIQAGNEIPEELQARAEKRRRVIAGTVIGSAAKQSSQSLTPLLHTNPSLAAQFPASFIFNETLGKWIPEGWEVKTIGELSDVISKGTTPRESDTEGMKLSIPFIKVRDIDDQGNLSFDLDLIPKEVHLKQLKRSILKKDDLLFSIAGTIGRVAVLPFRLHNSNCNQAVAFIRLADKKKYNILVHQFLRSDIIQSEIHSKVVQAVQANTSLKNLSDLKIVVSDIETIESFNNAMNEFYNRIALNKEKTETLTQLRDRLLPELISGRVRVKEELLSK